MKTKPVASVLLLSAMLITGCATQSVQPPKPPAPASATAHAPMPTPSPATPPAQPVQKTPYDNVQVVKKTLQPPNAPQGAKLELAYPEVTGLPSASVQQRINTFLKDKAIPKKFDASTDVNTDYTVKYQKGKILNLFLTGYVYSHGAAHGMPIQDSYIFNLENGATYTLPDLFKPGRDYLAKVSQIVKEDDVAKVLDTFNPFPGVKKDDAIYLDDGGFYVYFQPYQYTPYALGFPDFRVSYQEVADLINQDGDFWKALQPQDLSKPTENDIVYGESKKNAALIVAKGFQLQVPKVLPAATANDGAGSRLYAYFATYGHEGGQNQVFFFNGTNYLGTDTAKPHRPVPVSAKPAGPGAITVDYDDFSGSADHHYSVTYTYAGGKLTPDSNFSKLTK